VAARLPRAQDVHALLERPRKRAPGNELGFEEPADLLLEPALGIGKSKFHELKSYQVLRCARHTSPSGAGDRPLEPATEHNERAQHRRGTDDVDAELSARGRPLLRGGYWRSGDLWGDFAARAEAQPDKVALVLDDRQVTYAELRRAAVALSARLAAGSVKAGDVVILLGRHSIEATVALLGCLHRGVVLAPLPPMFNVNQLAALSSQTRAKGIVCFGGDKEIASASWSRTTSSSCSRCGPRRSTS
jgi:hypothetical protein